jgi:benzoylformate decarboxylase
MTDAGPALWEVKMNGATAFLELLRGEGVRYLFGNPGHTELPMLDALAGMPEMQYVLGLNEAVSMAMADGYAMAAGRLGVFCSHITPGFGNAIGMLYNASKTGAPLLLMAGQQDGRFSLTEPALWGDLVHLARAFTRWAYQVERAGDLCRAVRRAIKIATTPPTGPVFLSLPSDVLRGEAEFDLRPPAYVGTRMRADLSEMKRACELLREASEPLLIAGDEICKSGAEPELQALAELLGAQVYSEPSSNTFNFPARHPLYQGTLSRLQKGVREVLERADLICSVGADIFTMATYADLDPLPPGKRLIQLNVDTWQLGKNYPFDIALWGDARATLAEMVAELGARLSPQEKERALARTERHALAKAETLKAVERQAAAEAERQPMTGAALMNILVRLTPDDAIIVDESATTGITLRAFLSRREVTYYGLKGGGLGWGLPASIGVAFAQPERPVIALLGDGGAMYTMQGLWTAAHHRAKVVFVICNNRQYRIVKHRLHLYGGAAARNQKYLGVELREPAIDFAGLARAQGLWSARVEHPSEVADAFRAALAEEGPALLDVSVEGSYPENASAS